MKKISIIIPTYNERGNILKLIQKIEEHIDVKNFKYEIIIIDDNSPDLTGHLVKKHYENNNKIKIYIRKTRGLSSAIYHGIKKSSGEIVICMDADFNHHPKYIMSLVNQIHKHSLVIGSRFIKYGGMDNKIRYYFTFLFNIFLKNVLNFPSTDNMSGFFGINKKSLEKLPLDVIFQGYGEYHLRMVFFAKQINLKILEIPIYYEKRTYGKSKSNLIKMFIKYLYTAIKLSLFKK